MAGPPSPLVAEVARPVQRHTGGPQTTRGAEKVGEVVAVHVIARPHNNVDISLPLGRLEEARGVANRAIEILEAKDSWTKTEVRKAYKALIKVLHPDMNGGDRSHEDQLGEVVWAWDQIKDSRSFAD